MPDKIEIKPTFGWIGKVDDLEIAEIPIKPSILIRQEKRKLIQALQKENLEKLLPKNIKKRYTYHIISNGGFNYFTFVPVLVDILEVADEFYGSTWIMNRNNVIDMIKLYDDGKLKTINILTGLYFRRRQTAVYAELVSSLIDREQRYMSAKNHAKVILLCNYEKQDYFTVEGSANFTSNPRIEQSVLINDKEVFDFHKSWMEDIFQCRKNLK